MKSLKKNISIIISGPTASGKTSTSLTLANEIQRETGLTVSIVNFDSLLFYHELNIGTAKPASDELSSRKHFLINIKSAKSPMNASSYAEEAEKIIKKLHAENNVVILVGGSAFYIRALVKGMYHSRPTSLELQEKMQEIYDKEGINPFLDTLKETDPESFDNLHHNDHYRIMRAVEHFKMTGKKFSDEKKKLDINDPYDFSRTIHPDWNIFHAYLDLPKEAHQIIIQKRTEKMVNDGFREEVEKLLDSGFTGEEKPLKSVGYKEMVDYIRGKYDSMDECMERITISTRQLAKSQRTFFKKIHPKTSYNAIDDTEKLVSDVIKFICITP